ncbi:MAG: hypothetical protein AAFN04_15505, partial [Pseudomonadota bacterium]
QTVRILCALSDSATGQKGSLSSVAVLTKQDDPIWIMFLCIFKFRIEMVIVDYGGPAYYAAETAPLPNLFGNLHRNVTT